MSWPFPIAFSSVNLSGVLWFYPFWSWCWTGWCDIAIVEWYYYLCKKTLISLAIDLIINARWCPPPLLRLLANNLGSALPWKRYTCLYCTVLVCHPATLSWVFLACSFIPNITDLINQSINQSLHSTRTPIQFPYYHSGICQLLSLASSWPCRPTLWVQRIFNSLLLHFISKSFSNSLSLHSIVHVSQAFNKTLN